jgi:hypothetical protein
MARFFFVADSLQRPPQLLLSQGNRNDLPRQSRFPAFL